MAVVIVATAGSASANSFVTLAEAETYMEARLNAALWDAATDDTKNRALVEATREVSALAWDGKRATSTQALSWPRLWAVDPDDPNQDYYDSDVLPDRVKWATIELALQFVKAGTEDIAAVDSSGGVKREKVDVLETEYDPYRRPLGMDRYPRVLAWVAPLLSGPTTGGITVPVLRG